MRCKACDCILPDYYNDELCEICLDTIREDFVVPEYSPSDANTDDTTEND